MRLVLLVALILVGREAREAWATCSGCCDNTAELVGWSKDGRTYAVRVQVGTSAQQVIYRDGKEVERWGGDATDGCLFGGAKPAMPKDTFARYGLESPDAAWRDTFRSDYRVVPSKTKVVHNRAKCDGSDVVVNGDGRIVASFVRDCGEADACVTGSVGNGHVHPSKKFMLVKTRVTGCGHTSSTDFKLVRIRG